MFQRNTDLVLNPAGPAMTFAESGHKKTNLHSDASMIFQTLPSSPDGVKFPVMA